MLSPYFVKRFCIFLSNCCILKENNEKEQAYGGRKNEKRLTKPEVLN